MVGSLGVAAFDLADFFAGVGGPWDIALIVFNCGELEPGIEWHLNREILPLFLTIRLAPNQRPDLGESLEG